MGALGTTDYSSRWKSFLSLKFASFPSLLDPFSSGPNMFMNELILTCVRISGNEICEILFVVGDVLLSGDLLRRCSFAPGTLLQGC